MKTRFLAGATILALLLVLPAAARADRCHRYYGHHRYHSHGYDYSYRYAPSDYDYDPYPSGYYYRSRLYAPAPRVYYHRRYDRPRCYRPRVRVHLGWW